MQKIKQLDWLHYLLFVAVVVVSIFLILNSQEKRMAKPGAENQVSALQKEKWIDPNLVCESAGSSCKCTNDTIWNDVHNFCDKPSSHRGENSMNCPPGEVWVDHIKAPKSNPDRDPNLPRCAKLEQTAPLKVVNTEGSLIKYVFSQSDGEYVASVTEAGKKIKGVTVVKNDLYTETPD